MSSTQAEAVRKPPMSRRILLRLVLFLVLAFCVGQLFQVSQRLFRREPQPAGFARGVLHGALMPIALPTLAFGHDVEIYAQNNTGRGYKLGYTLGVNGCGALFFGVVFWRVNQWRRKIGVTQPGVA